MCFGRMVVILYFAVLFVVDGVTDVTGDSMLPPCVHLL